MTVWRKIWKTDWGRLWREVDLEKEWNRFWNGDGRWVFGGILELYVFVLVFTRFLGIEDIKENGNRFDTENQSFGYWQRRVWILGNGDFLYWTLEELYAFLIMLRVRLLFIQILMDRWTLWNSNRDLWKINFYLVITVIMIKGLNIESDNGAMRMKLWRFWSPGELGITFWANPKIGGGRIYSGFSHPRDSLLHLPHCMCSASNPRLMETGWWGFIRRI